jgi:hypothetical protein
VLVWASRRNELFEQVRFWICTRKKVPDGEDVIANTQDARASQKVAPQRFRVRCVLASLSIEATPKNSATMRVRVDQRFPRLLDELVTELLPLSVGRHSAP